jgi:hypothetical protein
MAKAARPAAVEHAREPSQTFRLRRGPRVVGEDPDGEVGDMTWGEIVNCHEKKSGLIHLLVGAPNHVGGVLEDDRQLVRPQAFYVPRSPLSMILAVRRSCLKIRSTRYTYSAGPGSI